MIQITLASQSPRRKKLLAEAGFSFDVKVIETEEIGEGAFFRHIPLINAVRKASQAADSCPERLVIGADTVIEFNGSIIGKPKDLDDARRILRLLSGQHHQVTTGICLICRERDIEIRFSVTSTIEFKPFGEDAIAQYLDKVHVLDKAGAYNLDEYGELLVERVDGPADNIIGLPCGQLSTAINAARCVE